MHTTTSINNQKSVIIRGLAYKVGSYISFHKELFYFYRHGMGIAQEIRPINRHKEVYLLGVDVPYKIVQVDTVHLANCTVKIPVITFAVYIKAVLINKRKLPQSFTKVIIAETSGIIPQYMRLIQISGTDFISLNCKPVYIKETKQIINKLRSVKQ